MPVKRSTSFGQEELASFIQKGICGSFVFFGEEDYLKSRYRDEIYRAVMSEGMETFNYFPISFSPAAGSRENAMSRLADAVNAVPMMQDKKLVVVSDLAPAGLPKELFESLCSSLSLADRSDDTVLILYCRADELETDYKLETSAVYKKLSACAKMVRFDLQSRGKLIAWTKRHFTKEAVLISDEAAGLLVDLCAGRMMPLSGEIQKLICYAVSIKKGTPPAIAEDDVKMIAAASSPDEVPFAMLSAAQSWKLSEMRAAMDTAREQREEPIAVLARLSRIYLDMLLIKTASTDVMSPAEIAKELKMKDFRVSKYLASIAKVPTNVIENAVKLAYQTDLRLKSTSSDPWVLIDEMIVRIYAPKSLRRTETGEKSCL